MTAAVWFVLVYGVVALGSSIWLGRRDRGGR